MAALVIATGARIVAAVVVVAVVVAAVTSTSVIAVVVARLSIDKVHCIFAIFRAKGLCEACLRLCDRRSSVRRCCLAGRDGVDCVVRTKSAVSVEIRVSYLS